MSVGCSLAASFLCSNRQIKEVARFFAGGNNCAPERNLEHSSFFETAYGGDPMGVTVICTRRSSVKSCWFRRLFAGLPVQRYARAWRDGLVDIPVYA